MHHRRFLLALSLGGDCNLIWALYKYPCASTYRLVYYLVLCNMQYNCPKSNKHSYLSVWTPAGPAKPSNPPQACLGVRTNQYHAHGRCWHVNYCIILLQVIILLYYIPNVPCAVLQVAANVPTYCAQCHKKLHSNIVMHCIIILFL